MFELPDYPVFEYLGVLSLVFGFFLVISGIGIIKVEKFSVMIGRKTWGTGIALILLGIAFLFFNNSVVSNTISSSSAENGNVEMELHTQLTNSAWTALENKEYNLAIEIADSYIKNFKDNALQIQKHLIESASPTPPVGSVHASQKDAIFLRDILNDTAACYYIKAQALYNLGQIDEAKDVYLAVLEFPDARVWNPNKNEFWNPSQSALEILSTLP